MRKFFARLLLRIAVYLANGFDCELVTRESLGTTRDALQDVGNLLERTGQRSKALRKMRGIMYRVRLERLAVR